MIGRLRAFLARRRQWRHDAAVVAAEHYRDALDRITVTYKHHDALEIAREALGR